MPWARNGRLRYAPDIHGFMGKNKRLNLTGGLQFMGEVPGVVYGGSVMIKENVSERQNQDHNAVT